MLILCFSDSHGNLENLEKAIKAHPNAELVFYLGDGLSDAEYAALDGGDKIMWLAVRGNCDFKTDFMSESAKFTEEITLFSKKILLTHGHMYSAKSSLYGLMELAGDRCAMLYCSVILIRRPLKQGLWVSARYTSLIPALCLITISVLLHTER